MKKFEPSDKFYTVLGVFVVMIGIGIYVLTSGVLEKNNKKVETNQEESSNSTTNSPSTDQTLNNQDTVLDESNNNTSIDDTNTNGSSVNDTTTTTPSVDSSKKDIMTCTQTLNENGIKSNTTCDLEFKNNLLVTQDCTGVITSDDATALAQQYAITQFVLATFNASTLDSSIMNSTLKYDEGKKITYTMFTDYKKIEENPDAISDDSSFNLSSKNTKEEVKSILSEENYTCK